uniref:Protein kinase domain-containing protein n=1 Tax=Chromera velia CCMP2878 TaxID=1169474 RepID=A0A0G4HZ62_9ALVE|eukprot:Cvel_9653.t1-p1 / transcript=Cvel_9653.t1 / gene=Cvel_9653 / organism=Chromera_velia_CCMP2878 / gene_product=hypothetical protein / transcript_product=hypothetical protein / location=Cvel_scaffold562:593-4874(-) / protein_length=163 / sequence_SO=supercontig / SO=protein_coding / is_pseudo=false
MAAHSPSRTSWDKFQPIRTLGDGSYGTVCLVQNRFDDSFSAIKKMKHAFDDGIGRCEKCISSGRKRDKSKGCVVQNSCSPTRWKEQQQRGRGKRPSPVSPAPQADRDRLQSCLPVKQIETVASLASPSSRQRPSPVSPARQANRDRLQSRLPLTQIEAVSSLA